MYSFLLFIFVANAAFLMLAILMQSNNAGGLSSTFGGVGGASASFGTRETASFLHKFTVIMTTSFFVLAIVIGLYSRTHFSNTTVEQSLIMQKGNTVPVEGLPTLDDTKLPLDNAVEETPVETKVETTLPNTEAKENTIPVEDNE
jgi:protein translocase SecG subunit